VPQGCLILWGHVFDVSSAWILSILVVGIVGIIVDVVHVCIHVGCCCLLYKIANINIVASQLVKQLVVVVIVNLYYN
jgi:hypothetical protein